MFRYDGFYQKMIGNRLKFALWLISVTFRTFNICKRKIIIAFDHDRSDLLKLSGNSQDIDGSSLTVGFARRLLNATAT